MGTKPDPFFLRRRLHRLQLHIFTREMHVDEDHRKPDELNPTQIA